MRRPRSPGPSFPIETDRLVLRACRDADRPVFARILNTPAMMAELGGMRSLGDIDTLIDKRIADQAKYGYSYWAVELRQSGELIGTCGLRIADNYPGTPVFGMHEMGWRIAESYWGKGLAHEAAEASIAWAWANTPALSVAAWTTSGNTRSLRLMERLGMARRPDLDFDRPTGRVLVHVIERPM
jgi:RimJ/RimL family protein N-acetyltransferase